MKRGTTGLCGVLAIDKPAGITSHDVVGRVRRITGERRVGHAGTLDPMATGVMLVCVGAATRLSQYLTGHDKCYRARIVFGASTDTDDIEGRVLSNYEQSGLDERLALLDGVDPKAQLAQLQGTQMQLPPAYSAIKKNGVKAYEAAREGKKIELEPREVTIYLTSLEETGTTKVSLQDGEGGRFEAELPYWDVSLLVSKGTYIRSIARDLGLKLGCGAFLGSLRRSMTMHIPHAWTSVTEKDLVTLEELEKSFTETKTLPWVRPEAVLGMPCEHITEQQKADVINGKMLHLESRHTEGKVCVARDGKVYGIYEATGSAFKPVTVIGDGVSGAAVRWRETIPSGYQAKPCALAIGVFDGVHQGHQWLFNKACERAKKDGLRDVKVMTFRNDPDELFGPKGPNGRPVPFKLQRNLDRIGKVYATTRRICAEHGLNVLSAPEDALVILPSDRETFSMQPLDFLEHVRQYLNPKSIVVGENFRFGARAAGDVDLLRSWGAEHDIDVLVEPLLELDGAAVSSTRIRELLREGDVAQAAKLLDRRHAIFGKVVHGRGEGTGMGFATANLALRGVNNGVVVPKEGVYAGYARIISGEDRTTRSRRESQLIGAAINLGVAKSFENATAEVEVHLLDFEGDIYDAVIAVEFIERLRDQRKFDDMDELIATVKADIARTRELTAKGGEV